MIVDNEGKEDPRKSFHLMLGFYVLKYTFWTLPTDSSEQPFRRQLLQIFSRKTHSLLSASEQFLHNIPSQLITGINRRY
jgi:hypothetical protein